MYESDYEDEAQFTEETLQDGLRELITEGYDSSEICWENLRVRTFAEEGVLTYNKGLVISLPRRHRIPADHRPEPLKHSGPG